MDPDLVSRGGPPGRRAVLAAGLLLPLAGCTRQASPGPAPPPDPDVALTAAAQARERTLIALYDHALAGARPVLAQPALFAVRAEHVAHLAALTPAPSGNDTGSASGTPTPAATGAAAAPLTGASPALADLQAAETSASAAHAGAVAGSSRALAQVLASLAAAELAHGVVLGTPGLPG